MPLIGSSTGSTKLAMGSQWSLTPKTKINSNASRKFGMQMPNRANVVPPVSMAVLRLVADRMPRGTATLSEMTIAKTASSREGLILLATSSMTGAPLRTDLPRSPRTSFDAQVAYCTGSGWSNPNSLRSVCFAVSSCDSPSMASTGSRHQVDQQKHAQRDQHQHRHRS